MFDIHDSTNAVYPFQFVCEMTADPDILKSRKDPKYSDKVEVGALGDLTVSNWQNISHKETYLHFIFEVICRLHEAKEAISLLCGNSEDE